MGVVFQKIQWVYYWITVIKTGGEIMEQNFSYTNMNGVTGDPSFAFSLNQMNGVSENQKAVYSLNNMNGISADAGSRFSFINMNGKTES